MTQSLIDQLCPNAPRATSPSFDIRLAAALCAASAATYDPHPIGEVIECPQTQTRVVISSAPDAGLPASQEGIIVAFRGTTALRNWLADADCLLTGYPCLDYGACRVHRGFWTSWLSVREKIWEALATRGITSRSLFSDRIYLTGHSLGGALAMIGAEQFRRRFGRAPMTCTFGQPRTGNGNFAAMFDLALKPFTWRVVHGDDVVPRAPWWLGGYRHGGREAFFGGTQGLPDLLSSARAGDAIASALPPGLMLNPAPLDKLPFDLRIAWREMRHGAVALLEDHHVKNYLRIFSPPPESNFQSSQPIQTQSIRIQEWNQ